MSEYLCPVEGGLRRLDTWGSGAFGASRGSRKHQGLDLVVDKGGAIRAPSGGEIVREARPYPNDNRYSGVLLRLDDGVELKIFYIEGWQRGRIERGDKIGIAQDLRKKYAKITNHVHVEAFVDGNRVDPSRFFQHCIGD